MTPHEKYMKNVFGVPAAETRKAQARISAELSAQGQHNPPAIPGDVLPGQESSCPPTGGPGPTASQVWALEEDVMSIAKRARNFPRHDWDKVRRDFLGTLWLNVRTAARELSRLESELQAHLDATRK